MVPFQLSIRCRGISAGSLAVVVHKVLIDEGVLCRNKTFTAISSQYGLWDCVTETVSDGANGITCCRLTTPLLDKDVNLLVLQKLVLLLDSKGVEIVTAIPNLIFNSRTRLRQLIVEDYMFELGLHGFIVGFDVEDCLIFSKQSSVERLTNVLSEIEMFQSIV